MSPHPRKSRSTPLRYPHIPKIHTFKNGTIIIFSHSPFILNLFSLIQDLIMPPKKAPEDTKNNVVAFGRVRKNLKMGCVSLPNVGNSPLFNLRTEQGAAAENYAFCAIEPDEARCAVPDLRCICECFVVLVSVKVWGESPRLR